MSASMARISHRATATLTSRTTPAARQGPGKVAIRPVYPMTPHRGPAPRDCVGPGREPDSSDRHGRTYGADRDFAGALINLPGTLARSLQCRSSSSAAWLAWHAGTYRGRGR